MKSLEERFWPKVDIRGPDDCWEWLAGKNYKGYGILMRKESKKAHRIAYELTYGPIPNGLHICHHCDNPGCMNPTHLFAGTDMDNTADCIRKGRFIKGEQNGQAKLTSEQVLSIRGEYSQGNTSYPKLGVKYNVDPSTIGKIINQETWRHI